MSTFNLHHAQHRDPKTGKYRPITYLNATRRVEGEFLIITHDGARPGERQVTSVPLMHVALITEALQ